MELYIKNNQRSEMANEVISSQSSFIQKWSLSIILCILFIIGLLSYFIKYPETITTIGTINSTNAPKEIISMGSGKLTKLFCSNGQMVKEGDMIGWIESTTDHNEALTLSHLLDSAYQLLEIEPNAKLDFLFRRRFRKLGPLQQELETFYKDLKEFQDYSVNGYYELQRKVLLSDMSTLKSIWRNLEDQRKAVANDMGLSDESYAMYDTLYQLKVISHDDLRAEKSKLLNKQVTLLKLDELILENKKSQTAKTKELLELEHQFPLQSIYFSQKLLSFLNTVKEWMKQYIIVTPESGRLSFIGNLQSNQYIKFNSILGYVVNDDNQYYAQVILPQKNFGKISIGQVVRIQSDAFPYEQFGSLKGNISYVSNIASDSGFLSNITFENNFITDYRKKLQFKNGMKIRTIITTRKLRLIERLFYGVRKIEF